MLNTNIIQFNSSKNNMMDDTTYKSKITNGIESNTIADSKIHNKLFYQVSTVVKSLTDFINRQGLDSMDTDLDALSENLENAIKQSIIQNLFTPVQNSGGGGTKSMI